MQVSLLNGCQHFHSLIINYWSNSFTQYCFAFNLNFKTKIVSPLDFLHVALHKVKVPPKETCPIVSFLLYMHMVRGIHKWKPLYRPKKD